MPVTTLFQNESFIWIDVLTPTIEELESISHQYHLNRLTLLDCLQPEHLPKFEELENAYFIINRCYSPRPDKKPHTIQDITSKVAIFYDSNFLISIHRKPQHFINEIKIKYVDSHKCSDVTAIVIKLVWACFHTYDQPAITLGEELEVLEKKIFLRHHSASLENMYNMKRQADSSRKTLLLAQDIIAYMPHEDHHNSELQDLKDLHTRLMTQYELIGNDVNNLLTIYLSLSAQKTNDVIKLLTVFSVFFMPLTFIVGVYGMNFENMPELKWKYGYYLSWGFMLLICLTIYLWFKKRKLM